MDNFDCQADRTSVSDFFTQMENAFTHNQSSLVWATGIYMNIMDCHLKLLYDVSSISRINSVLTPVSVDAYFTE